MMLIQQILIFLVSVSVHSFPLHSFCISRLSPSSSLQLAKKNKNDKNVESVEPFYNRVILPTFFPKAIKDAEIKTEDDLKREQLETKPWRDTKIKYLKYCYRPWKESYKVAYIIVITKCI